MPMTYREAVRLILDHGGAFLKHGAKHDVFIMPWGVHIAVPRHRKDLSPGVERTIKAQVKKPRQ